METAADLLSALELPPLSSLEMPSMKAEPDDNDLAGLDDDFDLSELDDLLAESMKAAKKKYVTPRDLIRRVAASNVPAAIAWIVMENIAIWERHSCSCGMTTPAIFLHYKQKKVSGKTTVWEKTDKPDLTKPLRHALKQRGTDLCEDCCDIDSDQMEDIANAF